MALSIMWSELHAKRATGTAFSSGAGIGRGIRDENRDRNWLGRGSSQAGRVQKPMRRP